MNSVQWSLLGIITVLVLWTLGAYNRLQQMRNRIGQAARGIEEAVRRRDELIAGLLTLLNPARTPAVEAGVLKAMDEASSHIMNASEALLDKPTNATLAQGVAVAEVGLQATLSIVLDRIEQDAALRLSPGMLERLAEISEAERRLRFERHLYNDAVKAYNAALQQWPTRLLRRLFDMDASSTI